MSTNKGEVFPHTARNFMNWRSCKWFDLYYVEINVCLWFKQVGKHFLENLYPSAFSSTEKKNFRVSIP